MPLVCCLLLFGGGFLAAGFLLPFFLDTASVPAALKPNWRGKLIPGTAGLVFPVLLSLVCLPLVQNGARDKSLIIFMFAVYGAAFLGLVDDMMGDAGPRGLTGHFGRLFRKRKISTGVVKALGTGVIALWVVLYEQGSTMGLDWLLLLLCVNFINLLDLRPGRAVKGTIFLFALSLLLPIGDYRFLSAAAGILIAYARYDLRGEVMLGDTGSNALGMAAGLVLLQAPFLAKLLLAAGLMVFQLACEKYSFSRIIEKNEWLRKIDRWGRD
jgi:UDP-N-acetylmuramyl pentapeptide phosphotransferase/UDP-N-acetylglucosamine-1-phosphate transferase